MYATELGANHLSDKTYFLPNLNSIFHDTKVSDLVGELSKMDRVIDFELEHEYRNTRRDDYYNRSSYIPDAVLKVMDAKGKSSMDIGLELELTQKSEKRISTKIKKGLIDNRYDLILYFFPSEALYKKYLTNLNLLPSKEARAKCAMFWTPDLIQGELNIESIFGSYLGRPALLSQFLGNIRHE